MKTTIVASYSNAAVAYYALLNLNRAGCEAADMGLIMQQKPLAGSRVPAESEATLKDHPEFNSVINSLTGLLKEVTTIFAPSRLRIIVSGLWLNLMNNRLDEPLSSDVDSVTNSLMSALLELNVMEDDAASFADGVQAGNILIVAQVDDDLRENAISVIDAFLPTQLARCRSERQKEYVMARRKGQTDDTRPARGPFIHQVLPKR